MQLPRTQPQNSKARACFPRPTRSKIDRMPHRDLLRIMQSLLQIVVEMHGLEVTAGCMYASHVTCCDHAGCGFPHLYTVHTGDPVCRIVLRRL